MRRTLFYRDFKNLGIIFSIIFYFRPQVFSFFIHIRFLFLNFELLSQIRKKRKGK
jgi:hypothetical protein